MFLEICLLIKKMFAVKYQLVKIFPRVFTTFRLLTVKRKKYFLLLRLNKPGRYRYIFCDNVNQILKLIIHGIRECEMTGFTVKTKK